MTLLIAYNLIIIFTDEANCSVTPVLEEDDSRSLLYPSLLLFLLFLLLVIVLCIVRHYYTTTQCVTTTSIPPSCPPPPLPLPLPPPYTVENTLHHPHHTKQSSTDLIMLAQVVSASISVIKLNYSQLFQRFCIKNSCAIANLHKLHKDKLLFGQIKKINKAKAAVLKVK